MTDTTTTTAWRHLTAAEVQTRILAERAGTRADYCQDQADALDALRELVDTDPRFAILRDSYTAEAMAREARELAEAAEESRETAARLGFVPR